MIKYNDVQPETNTDQNSFTFLALNHWGRGFTAFQGLIGWNKFSTPRLLAT